jgi:hypothetical protein
MITVEISSLPNQISIAVELIQKLIKKNKLNFDFTIKLDYLLPKAGEWDRDNPYELKINPFICLEKITYTYTEDYTMFGSIMHEFAHFITLHYFRKFVRDYTKTFPEERLLITGYEQANEEIPEEIAELVSLFIRNPLLLKLISKKHFDYINSWFKSPVPHSFNRFIFMYNQMPVKYKNILYKKYGIVVNQDKKTVRVDKQKGNI